MIHLQKNGKQKPSVDNDEVAPWLCSLVTHRLSLTGCSA